MLNPSKSWPGCLFEDSRAKFFAQRLGSIGWNHPGYIALGVDHTMTILLSRQEPWNTGLCREQLPYGDV